MLPVSLWLAWMISFWFPSLLLWFYKWCSCVQSFIQSEDRSPDCWLFYNTNAVFVNYTTLTNASHCTFRVTGQLTATLIESWPLLIVNSEWYISLLLILFSVLIEEQLVANSKKSWFFLKITCSLPLNALKTASISMTRRSTHLIGKDLINIKSF